MFDFNEQSSSYIDSEDVSQLKSDSRLAEDINYRELVVREKCEKICSKWLLLQGEHKSTD